MSDLGDTFKAFEGLKREERLMHGRQNVDLLESIDGLDYRILSVYHYRLCTSPEIDFWPTTGKWIELGTNRKGHGLDSLLRYLKASGQLT